MNDHLQNPGETMPDGAPAPDRTVPLMPVSQMLLGRYRVIGELGRGGMGIAFRCHDTVSRTDVCVKVLRGAAAEDRKQMESVRENFSLVERLHHPNIAAIKTLERDAKTGNYLVVMEYIEGLPLDRYVADQGGRLTAAQALPIIQQVASALDYGHGEKIVHRDIKPANILVNIRGRAKVLDFGIANRFHEFGADTHEPVNFISGTAAYMAPEQWKGQFQDARTDQYALAALACQLLAGRPPFVGASSEAIRQVAISQAPDLPDTIGPDLKRVLLKGLAKDRGDRYPSCADFARDLQDAVILSGSVGALSLRRRGLVYAGVGLLALVVAGGIVFMKKDARTARTSTPAAVAAKTSAAPAAATTPLAYRALVIGISDYESHGAEGWNDLETASKDARAIADTLQKEYGFDVRTLLDGQATRSAIMDALDDLTNDKDNDAVLVYYAGHGQYEEKLGEGYWIPHDARLSHDGKSSRDGWIWNSTINKIVNASPARHVLIIADACYGGSLFRSGDAPQSNRQLQWYKRAVNVPSRYLITSGDLEPVLDSGSSHSVFCQSVLNYLGHPEKDIFSASDLGASIKEKVSMMTGQLVRMGQLPVASHAGGEFVFMRGAEKLQVDTEVADSTTPPAIAPVAEVKRDWSTAAQDAVVMARQGATNAAQKLVTDAASATGDKRLLEILNAYVRGEQKQRSTDRLQQLIERLEKKADAGARADDGYARPRILACLGPETKDSSEDGESLALLYRIMLRSELESVGGLSVVERDALEETMQELNLGASNISDKRAQLEIGKLLPACLILLGDIFKDGDTEQLYVRLVDTETTRVVGSFTASVKKGEAKSDACRKLAADVASRAQQIRPLEARVLASPENTLVAGVGSFHGAVAGQRFEVVQRTPGGSGSGRRETVVGTASISRIGDITSDLNPQWSASTPPPKSSDDLWVREIGNGPHG